MPSLTTIVHGVDDRHHFAHKYAIMRTIFETVTREEGLCMECMKRIECPQCGGRVCDISKAPREQIRVELKCPKCHKIVAIDIAHTQGDDKQKI